MIKNNFNENWIYEGKNICLPHDAMLVSGRDPKSPTGSAGGFFKPGIYEYTKKFDVPADWKDKHIEIEFEGVYKDAEVSLNGVKVGGCAYGYIPFTIDLDGKLEYGKENTIRVVADCSKEPDSRWYTGGGIYRPVNLYVSEKEHIESVKIDTLSYAPAKIKVTIMHNSKDAVVEIFKDGKKVASGKGDENEIEIADAKLWDAEHPELYICKVSVASGDTYETKFGIRKVEKTKDGLLVNGKKTLLKGGCLHHDNGILGACAYEGAEYRRVRKMKDAGYNAIRSAHNPCSVSMLEACDELGMYMMDETWDMWFHHKSAYDYASVWREHYLDDIKAMVNRDYNHPSVILYSIGNEVSEPAKDEGVEKIREMVNLIHSLDSNRLVSAGFNLMIIASSKKGKGIYDDEKGGQKSDNSEKMKGMSSTMFNLIASMVGTGMNNSANSDSADKAVSPALDLLDVAGYNYASGRYKKDEKLHPDRLVYGSETFPQDIAKNWRMIKEGNNLCGDFMWTAWDYLGEAGIGAWAYSDDGKGFNKPYPWMMADVGAFDLIGTPGAPIAYARVAWEETSKPWIGIQPVNHNNKVPAKGTWRGSNAIDSYSFAGCNGNKMIAEVYGNGTAVELFQNGKSLGKKKLKDSKILYKGKYIPGKLEAVLYNGNEEISRSELVTAGGNISIVPTVEEYKGLYFVEVSLKDENGITESNRDEYITVKVDNGTLLGFGSANPRTEESFLSGAYRTYYGHALAIVKGGPNTKVTFRGDTLKETEITL